MEKRLENLSLSQIRKVYCKIRKVKSTSLKRKKIIYLLLKPLKRKYKMSSTTLNDLYKTIENNEIKKFIKILEKNPDWDFDKSLDEKGDWPYELPILHFAIKYKRDEMVKYLIEN